MQKDLPLSQSAGTAQPGDSVLTMNGGSSSIKFAIFKPGLPLTRRVAGAVERIGLPETVLRTTKRGDSDELQPLPATDFNEAVAGLLDWLTESGELARVTAIGHRVVHGGPNYIDPQVVTPKLLADLREAITFAPNHLPMELALIEATVKRLPKVPQVVCFDTTFHKRLAGVHTRLPIPRRYHDAGVRRYGFHGLSFSYLMEELRRQAGPEIANGKVILAHLGSGSSLAAIEHGRSIDTTMGFTPTGGVMMATRTGDIDPGVLLHILRTEGLSADQLDHLVNRESGILGVSGTTSDMRDLVARKETDPTAKEAFNSYCYSIRKGIGAMVAVNNGAEALVFSGGIGEHLPEARSRILNGLGHVFGIRVDPALNEANAPVISKHDSPCTVRVIPTDEESMIAQITLRVLSGTPEPKNSTGTAAALDADPQHGAFALGLEDFADAAGGPLADGDAGCCHDVTPVRSRELAEYLNNPQPIVKCAGQRNQSDKDKSTWRLEWRLPGRFMPATPGAVAAGSSPSQKVRPAARFAGIATG